VSYNYVVDIKGVSDAPRIVKLQKIQDLFKPTHRRGEFNAGVGRDTLSQQRFAMGSRNRFGSSVENASRGGF
jgi:hypothetical protein